MAAELWQGVSCGLASLQKTLKALSASIDACGAPSADVDIKDWSKVVQSMCARSANTPTMLVHESPHRAGALKAAKKLAKALVDVNRTSKASFHMYKKAAVLESSKTKKAGKALIAAWKQWEANEPKLRVLLKMAPRVPPPVIAPVAAGRAAPQLVSQPLPSGAGIAAVTTTARQRALRSRRFSSAGQADSGAPECGQLLRADDGSLLKGTNTSIEKSYLRLTPGMLPRVADVRPPTVLAKSLEHVKKQWADGASYEWVNDQLKAIRQDAVVQGLRGPLVESVYECHARIALEASDQAAHQQCQSMLRPLHEAKGFKGTNCMEFAAYRIMLAAVADASSLLGELRSLPLQALSHPYVKHALGCHRAYTCRNWIALLRLYDDAPRMSPYLMDQMFDRLRRSVLRTVLLSYRPSVPADEVSLWLGFIPVDESDREQCEQFLAESGCVMTNAGGALTSQVAPGVVIDCVSSLKGDGRG